MMIGRVLKIHLIQAQNLFEFDLKHGYCKIMTKIDFIIMTLL